MDIQQIDAADAAAHLEAGDALFVDVRDPASFEEAHIEGALHLTDQNIQGFIAEADKSRRVIVYCYHGNMSQGGAAYLAQQGFGDVWSMRGGFEEWRTSYPFKPSTP